MSTGPQNDVLALQADEFGDPQSRLDPHQQEGLVPTSYPLCRIRRTKNRVDLLTREVFNQCPFVPLAWNRKYPATQVGATWLMERDVAEKGMDCRQASVPGPHAVIALFLEVVEELADKGSGQIFE
jgi:hypothetical protein